MIFTQVYDESRGVELVSPNYVIGILRINLKDKNMVGFKTFNGKAFIELAFCDLFVVKHID